MARPHPTHEKMSKDSNPPFVSATAMAEPKNGAEHGVAKIAANNPDKKSPNNPLVLERLLSFVIILWGNNILRAPNILRENKINKRIMKLRNVELWNCMPQPISRPDSFNNNKVPLRAHIKVKIPNADTKNLKRTSLNV